MEDMNRYWDTWSPYWSYIENNFLDIEGIRKLSIDDNEWQQAAVFVSLLCRDHGLMAIQPDGKGDITATHVLRQEKKNVSEVPSPLYYEGRVYMVANGGIVTCVDAKSGTLVYRQRIPATGAYYASPVVAQNRIYISSSEGIITVIAAGTKPDIIAEIDIGEPVFATPSIVDTHIYVRTASHMYAFGH
jgi:outer membrane protein assembly factor BamB